MRSPEIASLVLAAALALPLAVGPTAEATIALDASFGEGGKVVAPITSFTGASDVAILADGKFVATGAGPASDLTVARFHPDGSLDASFGTGGMAVASFIDPTFGRLTSAGQRILVQGDRKVVAVGFADASDREIALARFDEQGKLDGTFGNGGMVRTPIGIADPPFGGHGARDVADAALQADEKILVVSNVTGSIGHTQAYARGFLLRYDTRGSLDATFGAGGVLLARPADPRVYAYSSAVAVQEDGKIVTAGFFVAGTSGAYRYGSLIRYDQRGNLDLTFGDRGLAPNVTTARPGIQFSQNGLIFDRAGRLLIGGGVIDGGTDAFGLLRYNASGALDSTFGTDGLAITSIQTHSFMNALVLSRDSVIGGGQSEGTTTDFALAQYTDAGGVDETTSTPIGSGKASVKALGVTPDGKVLAAGASGEVYRYAWTFARYEVRESSSTTTTLPSATTPCGTPRCALQVALQSSECTGQSAPEKVEARISEAAMLCDQAPASTPRKAKKLHSRVKRLLKRAAKGAISAGRGRKPAVSRGCGTALGAALRSVANGLSC